MGLRAAAIAMGLLAVLQPRATQLRYVVHLEKTVDYWLVPAPDATATQSQILTATSETSKIGQLTTARFDLFWRLPTPSSIAEIAPIARGQTWVASQACTAHRLSRVGHVLEFFEKMGLPITTVRGLALRTELEIDGVRLVETVKDIVEDEFGSALFEPPAGYALVPSPGGRGSRFRPN